MKKDCSKTKETNKTFSTPSFINKIDSQVANSEAQLKELLPKKKKKMNIKLKKENDTDKLRLDAKMGVKTTADVRARYFE